MNRTLKTYVELGSTNVHELVDAVHALITVVGTESRVILVRALQEHAEELVQMSEEEAVEV